MTNTGAGMHTITLEKGLATFLDGLHGKNRSSATIRAYQTDIAQFISFLHANNVSIHTPADVEKVDIVEYLCSLAHIPPDLVVDPWTSDAESSSPPDFLLRHDLWTTFRRLMMSQITSTISTSWDFTTKSGGIWKNPHSPGLSGKPMSR